MVQHEKIIFKPVFLNCVRDWKCVEKSCWLKIMKINFTVKRKLLEIFLNVVNYVFIIIFILFFVILFKLIKIMINLLIIS